MKKTHFLPSILIPVLFLANSFFFAEKAFSQCVPLDPISTPGTSTFEVPEGVFSITVEVWGGGGAGGGTNNQNNRGGGGGAGSTGGNGAPGSNVSQSVGGAAGDGTTQNRHAGQRAGGRSGTDPGQ